MTPVRSSHSPNLVQCSSRTGVVEKSRVVRLARIWTPGSGHAPVRSGSGNSGGIVGQPEVVHFEEMNGDVPEADLWPRTTSVLPVIQEPTIRRLGHPRCVYAERGCSLAALE
jgi:hypothetical protein